MAKDLAYVFLAFVHTVNAQDEGGVRMYSNKVEICNTNTAELPVPKEKGKMECLV